MIVLKKPSDYWNSIVYLYMHSPISSVLQEVSEKKRLYVMNYMNLDLIEYTYARMVIGKAVIVESQMWVWFGFKKMRCSR